MRQFSILVIFVLAFGGAAVLYEKESRKVKGVLTQITDLQAQLGDLQAEVNRLSGELEAVKLAERRRPDLKTIAGRRAEERPAKAATTAARTADSASPRRLIASDVTSAPPAIRARGDEEADESGWSRPTIDAEQYQPADSEPQEPLDPYQ